jgi:hypothetical protein
VPHTKKPILLPQMKAISSTYNIINEQTAKAGIWSFYPELVIEMKKKKCCKNYKKDKRCKKCPMNC